MRSTSTSASASRAGSRAVAAALACVAPLVWAGTAAAGTPASAVEKAGWWWQRVSPVAGVDEPSSVPAGELGVGVTAAGSQGPSVKVAAVQLALPDPAAYRVSSVVVDLALDSASSVNAAGASLVACRATSGWTAASGGAWSARPAADCASPIAVTATSGGYRVDVTPLVPAWSSSNDGFVLQPKAVDGQPFQLALTPAAVRIAAEPVASPATSAAPSSGPTASTPPADLPGTSASLPTGVPPAIALPAPAPSTAAAPDPVVAAPVVAGTQSRPRPVPVAQALPRIDARSTAVPGPAFWVAGTGLAALLGLALLLVSEGPSPEAVRARRQAWVRAARERAAVEQARD